MESESSRDGHALREMAKLAGPASSPRAVKPNADSSGLVDLAALMAEQPNWLDDALARAKGSPKTVLPPPHSVAPLSLGPTAIEIMTAESLTAMPRRRPLPLILATFGAGALVAAACVFALKLEKPAAPRVATVTRVEEPVTPPAPPAEVAAAVAAPTQVAAAAATQVTTAPESSPPAEKEAPSAPGHHHHRVLHESAHAAAFIAKADPKPDPEPAPPPARKAAAQPPPATALEAAVRAAAGPSVATAPPPPVADVPAPVAAKAAAAPVMEGRPERPSGSAVTSTLTEVLPKVRKCVSGTDPSRATITFGQEGAVQSVSVSGPAASDPKTVGCMKSAFGKAHVPPFSQASYSAAVTVRPL